MALSDCSTYWETLCVCGRLYVDWKTSRRVELASAVLGIDKEILVERVKDLEILQQKKVTSFKVIYNLKSIGTYDTFKEAFKALYEKVQSEKKKGLTEQLLFNAVWIEQPPRGIPVFFLDAIELAHTHSLLTTDGKLTY